MEDNNQDEYQRSDIEPASDCSVCACPDQWSRDFLTNHLKQHLATCTHKINGKYTHGYINQALRYIDECKRCSGTKIPVGPYHIMSEYLTPRLQAELNQLHGTDSTNVLMQAVSGIFKDINPELYRKYVSHESQI